MMSWFRIAINTRLVTCVSLLALLSLKPTAACKYNHFPVDTPQCLVIVAKHNRVKKAAARKEFAPEHRAILEAHWQGGLKDARTDAHRYEINQLSIELSYSITKIKVFFRYVNISLYYVT